MVVQLMSYGADPGLQDGEGKTRIWISQNLPQTLMAGFVCVFPRLLLPSPGQSVWTHLHRGLSDC